NTPCQKYTMPYGISAMVQLLKHIKWPLVLALPCAPADTDSCIFKDFMGGYKLALLLGSRRRMRRKTRYGI
ncbi:hypothetical protein NDU88_004885, partial [Pleurodeles waltl]